jgi:hypothetical protein
MLSLIRSSTNFQEILFTSGLPGDFKTTLTLTLNVFGYKTAGDYCIAGYLTR